jgi:hypothetical protein
MRMSFVVVVLFVSMLFWQFIEYQANASLGEVVERKALPMDVLYETMEARTYLNSIRKLMKMQRLAENKQLKSAAQAHADYLVLNDESAHEEIMAHKNFTGITPVERAFHAGYASSQLSENLSTKNHNARTSVDGLLSAIYHRFGFLYDGEEEVPPAFYSEIPDPLPDHEVSGFPISVEFNDYFFKNVTLHSFRLYVEGGEEVGDIRLMDKHSDPHQKFTANQYALFPLQRLEYNQEYRAEISYTSKGKKETLIWYFHTRKPTEEFHLITQKEETISIDHGKSHIVYFRPHDPHDIIKNIQFPVDIDITFLDNNTIKLTLMSDEIDEFDITSDTRRLHIDVK